MEAKPFTRGMLPIAGRYGIVAAAMLLAGLGAAPVISYGLNETLPVIPQDGFATALEGPLSVVLREKGELESSKNKVIVSKCEWKVGILWLAPQGSLVESGELIAELDSSELRQKAREREVLLLQARLALALAESDVQIQDLTNESTQANAELQALLTELQLNGYQRVQFPQERLALESQVALAQEGQNSAKQNYEFTLRMVRLGYRNPSERDSTRIRLAAATHALRVAEDKLRVLTKYMRDRQVTELTALFREGQRNLQRSEVAGQAAALDREIRVQAARRVVAEHQAFLERIQRSIEACQIHAPHAGQVIYARQSWRANRPVEPGDEIRHLRPIIKLPDRDQLQIALRLHESKIQRVCPGQPAEITIDALPQEKFLGHVVSMSTVPLRGQYPNFDRREYEVVVKLDEDREVLRRLAPGMTASAQISTAHRRHTLRVPVNSVVEVAGRDVAFVRRGDDVVPREVETGLLNDDSVEVLVGLKPGEEVVLQPRVTCARLLTALQSRWLSKSSAEAPVAESL